MYNQRVICRSVLALYIDLTDSSDNADPASPYTVSVGNPWHYVVVSSLAAISKFIKVSLSEI